jgi:hypothetical protein
MAKESKPMTRIVAIGTLKTGEYKEDNGMYKGSIDTGKGTVSFVFFNAKATAQNPHTRAKDFSQQFKPKSEDYPGDKVFVTGTDSRNYSEEKDTHYESIQGWDFRAAEEDEAPRWVYVYVADVKDGDEETINLSFINYKDEETIFPINITPKTKIEGDLEEGCRVKVKGEIFSGLKMDFYGDGEYVTERTAVEVKVLHSAAEIEEFNTPSEDNAMWD